MANTYQLMSIQNLSGLGDEEEETGFVLFMEIPQKFLDFDLPPPPPPPV